MCGARLSGYCLSSDNLAHAGTYVIHQVRDPLGLSIFPITQSFQSNQSLDQTDFTIGFLFPMGPVVTGGKLFRLFPVGRDYKVVRLALGIVHSPDMEIYQEWPIRAESHEQVR